jgi:demethylmenaquinone methyltransferase / 2-methoxy-6-polyprenyl-1,4-benzoquinol methylase
LKILKRQYDKERIKRSYKNMAPLYNLWSRLTESKTAERVLQLSGIENNSSVLEAAAGTGIVFEKIVRRNPDGNNVGIDLSPDMLRRARKRLQKLTRGNYVLEEGDIINSTLGFSIIRMNNAQKPPEGVENYQPLPE